MEELITIRDMCKIYNPGENEVRALDHVNLTIHKNEFVAIIGQSGSGKSTLMNMLGCLDVPTSGTYLLNGKDVSHMTDDELSDIRFRTEPFKFFDEVLLLVNRKILVDRNRVHQKPNFIKGEAICFHLIEICIVCPSFYGNWITYCG